MQTKRLITLFAFLIASIASAKTSGNSQQVHLYVQPSVGVVALGEDFKSTGTVSIAAGVTWAPHQAVELEYTYFKTEPDVRYPTFDLKYSIILATYKYSFLLRHGLAVQAGASVGQVSQQITARAGYRVIGEDTDDTAAFGLSGGVSYRLNDNVVFEGSAKLLAVNETRFTTSGSIAMLQGGVRFEF